MYIRLLFLVGSIQLLSLLSEQCFSDSVNVHFVRFIPASGLPVISLIKRLQLLQSFSKT